MSTEISWVFEAAVKPDALDECGALAREISAGNQAAEPGQQIFEWFLDGQDIHIYERYQDSDAALAHVQRFVDNFASRFLSLCTPTLPRTSVTPAPPVAGGPLRLPACSRENLWLASPRPWPSPLPSCWPAASPPSAA